MQSKDLTIKVMSDRSSELVVILADDGYNPFRIPLTLEEAEELQKELNKEIEKMRAWREYDKRAEANL